MPPPGPLDPLSGSPKDRLRWGKDRRGYPGVVPTTPTQNIPPIPTGTTQWGWDVRGSIPLAIPRHPAQSTRPNLPSPSTHTPWVPSTPPAQRTHLYPCPEGPLGVAVVIDGWGRLDPQPILPTPIYPINHTCTRGKKWKRRERGKRKGKKEKGGRGEEKKRRGGRGLGGLAPPFRGVEGGACPPPVDFRGQTALARGAYTLPFAERFFFLH